ncbi:MAG: dihydrodipicolinate synthase family protein [Oscillospiraceae bacterium]
MFKMKGVVPPMITPFKDNGEVDYDSLKKLTDFLKERVNGVFITGSYGGGSLMSVEERKKVAENVIKNIKGEIPVIVHVGTTNNAQTIDLTKHAIAAGADAVSAVGPYYYKHNEDEICCFYDDIVKTVQGRVTVYVYNNPQFQGYPMSLELVKRLKDSVGVTGIKDATFDTLQMANYLRTLKNENFDVALGTESLWLSSCVLGCESFIPGLGNAFPEICGKLYTEGAAFEIEKCRETQFEVNELRDIMYLARSTQLAIYAMLDIRGIIKAYPRAPFIPSSEEEKKVIAERLRRLSLII